MLTAEKARELASDFEKRRQAGNYVEDYIFPQIEKWALRGSTELIFKISKPELENFIVSELENLGYCVKKIDGYYNSDLYTSYVVEW